jgi:hypothetical protein
MSALSASHLLWLYFPAWPPSWGVTQRFSPPELVSGLALEILAWTAWQHYCDG